MIASRKTGLLLEEIYERYHKPEYIYPDPLIFPRMYNSLHDREIAAIVASSLALGRVDQILKAVKKVLSPFSSLHRDLKKLYCGDLEEIFAGFSYRFFKTSHIASFLSGIAEVLRKYGSVGECFRFHHKKEGSIVPAIHSFNRKLLSACPACPGILVTESWKGSAFKRFNLFLRWMVRNDEIDPGGWDFIDKSELIVPLDTHMMRIGKLLGLTARTVPSLKTAMEITTNLRMYDKIDPVRYDFSLTRLGIHPDLTIEKLKILEEKQDE